jgi:hypothetical protein
MEFAKVGSQNKVLKGERRLRIEEILGTKLSEHEYKHLISGWYWFYCEYERYANTPIVDILIKEWLPEIRK